MPSLVQESEYDPSPGSAGPKSRVDPLFLIISCSSSLYFTVIGQLYAAEALLLILLPILLADVPKGRRRLLGTVGFLCLLWLLGLTVADINAGPPASDTLRSVAAIAFTFVDVAGLIGLITRIPQGARNRSIVYAFIAIAIGQFAQIKFQPSPFFAAAPWKFGYALPVTLLGVAVSAALCISHRRLSLFCLLTISAVNFSFAYRSMAAICIATMVWFWFASRPKVRQSRRQPKRHTVAIALGLVVAALVLTHFYSVAANSGLLGHSAESKYKLQSAGGSSIEALLLGGRSSLVFAGKAVEDSPILGRGSLPVLTDQEKSSVVTFLTSRGYVLQTPDFQYMNSSPFQAHSYILQSWLEAGILGAIPFLIVLIYLGRAVLRSALITPGSLATAFLCFYVLWADIASPYGANQRFFLALAVALASVTLAERNYHLVAARRPSSQ